MKTILKSVLTLTLAAGLGIAANAQKATFAPASATVLANLTITLDGAQNEIAFGNLSALTPGLIVLDANGTTNANTGTLTKVARFDLAGANAPVTITYDAEVILTKTGEGVQPTMTMTPEVVGAALSTNQTGALEVLSAASRTLAEGVYFLWVGGTIPRFETTAQASGVYSGQFDIAVEYN